MERRRYLSALGTVSVGGVVTGCIAPDQDNSTEPSSQVSVCAEPGETTTLSIQMQNISQLIVTSSELVVRYEDISANPPFSNVRDSYPPQYLWENESVTANLSIPIRVPASLSPGEYTLMLSTDRETSPETVTITVGDCEGF